MKLFPCRLDNVLTDGGCGFKKEFTKEVKSLHKSHWHTYPRTPKMNAQYERFSRTFQKGCMNYHIEELMDPSEFNKGMADYLLWYNRERPRWSLNLQAPLQFLAQKHFQECNMGWPYTVSGEGVRNLLPF